MKQDKFFFKQSFLLLEERDNSMVNNNSAVNVITKNNDIKKDNGIDMQNYTNAIVISNVTAKWTKYQTVNTIENIDLNVKTGGLVAIIGPVGAGKVLYYFTNRGGLSFIQL